MAGYWFTYICDSYKYRARMLDGFRLLIECSTFGVVLLMLSRTLICLGKFLPQYADAKTYWSQISDVPYLGTFFLCLPLAILVANLWNLFVDSGQERERAVREHGDALVVLMQESFTRERLLSITMDSRKWYVGYVVGEQTLKPSEKYFQLLLVLSGYRDKDTMEVHRSVTYPTLDDEEDGHATVRADDFIITLPIQLVRSASFFDPDVYEDSFQGLETTATSQP